MALAVQDFVPHASSNANRHKAALTLCQSPVLFQPRWLVTHGCSNVHTTSIPEFLSGSRQGCNPLQVIEDKFRAFLHRSAETLGLNALWNMVLDTESKIFFQINIRKDPESFCCCFMGKVKSMIPLLSASRFCPCFCFSQKAKIFCGCCFLAFPLKANGNTKSQENTQNLKISN